MAVQDGRRTALPKLHPLESLHGELLLLTRSISVARLAVAALALMVLGCGAGDDGVTAPDDVVTSLQLSGVPDTLAVG